MSQWYLAFNGQQWGPLDLAAARTQARAIPDGFCWRAGLAEWIPIANAAELSASAPAMLPAAPPPTGRRTADVIDYRIHGEDMQFVEIELDPGEAVVSEAGASVYSASEFASRELPELDVSLRGAVSIARRLQDPLAELVKIDPKSIGVGQYQHDVSEFQLARSLDAVVEDCVNAVGVDVNTASAQALGQRIRDNYPAITVCTGRQDPAGHDLVVNATPLGMNEDDPLPLDVSRLDARSFVGEVVMRTEMTAFLTAAAAKGCKVQVGSDMLFEMIPAYLEYFGFPTASAEELRTVAQLGY